MDRVEASLGLDQFMTFRSALDPTRHNPSLQESWSESAAATHRLHLSVAVAAPHALKSHGGVVPVRSTCGARGANAARRSSPPQATARGVFSCGDPALLQRRSEPQQSSRSRVPEGTLRELPEETAHVALAASALAESRYGRRAVAVEALKRIVRR
jgi:hypothetical protein